MLKGEILNSILYKPSHRGGSGCERIKKKLGNGMIAFAFIIIRKSYVYFTVITPIIVIIKISYYLVTSR